MRTFADEGPPLAALLSEVLEAQQAGCLDSSTHVPAHYLRKLLAAERRDACHVRLPQPLSGRELEVLALVAAGRSSPAIARELKVGVNTVKTHLKGVYGKLGVHSREQAVRRARELRLLDGAGSSFFRQNHPHGSLGG